MKRGGIYFLIMVLLIAGVIKVMSLIAPVNRYDNTRITVRINPGSNSKSIGKQLFDRELIKSYLLFNIIVSIRGIDQRLKAGYYEFSPSDNMLEIIQDISQGKVANFKVTIPEGYPVEKVAGRLSGVTDYSKNDFLREAKNEELVKDYIDISEKDISEKEVKYPVEGFLYPDTYFIPRTFTPFKILKVMIDNFEKKWWKRLETKTEEREYGAFDILIIASLIEKEGKLGHEKPIIAGVIYNRIQQEMKLQIDAGIQYSLEQRKDRISYEDVKIDSPYNTYLYHGLPPGPICNPGDKAIEAALSPADVDFLYYFALNDGSHFFTETYEDHLRMQAVKKGEGLIDGNKPGTDVNE